jgi:antitoxin component of RelBE/YafQ-DinJ toxin-antitoxin module
MNKHIQIRDVDTDVHDKLAKAAAALGLSMSQYLRIELKTLANKPATTDFFQRLRQLPRKNTAAVDAAELIRNMREERTLHVVDGFNES